MTRGKRSDWAVTSRKVAFWAGLAGLGYETLYEDVDRPWLFLVFLTMMGLAQFGRVFELLNRSDGLQINGIQIKPSGETAHVPPASPTPESKEPS